MFVNKNTGAETAHKKREKKSKIKTFISIFNKKEDSEEESPNVIETLNKDDATPNADSIDEVEDNILDDKTNQNDLSTENTMDNTEQTNAFAKALEDGFAKVISAFAPQTSENEGSTELQTKLQESQDLVISLQAQIETLTNEKTELETKVADFETKAKADEDAMAQAQEDLIQAQYVAKAKDEFSHLVGTPEEVAAKLRKIDAIEDEATKETVLEALKIKNQENETLTTETGTETSSGEAEVDEDELLIKNAKAKAEAEGREFGVVLREMQFEKK